jgi:sulfide:quinone oxidoreductase
LREGDRLTVVGEGPRYHFVPSNPWVAIGWRKREDVEVDLEQVMRRKGIRYIAQGARRVHPMENRFAMTTW